MVSISQILKTGTAAQSRWQKSSTQHIILFIYHQLHTYKTWHVKVIIYSVMSWCVSWIGADTLALTVVKWLWGLVFYFSQQESKQAYCNFSILPKWNINLNVLLKYVEVFQTSIFVHGLCTWQLQWVGVFYLMGVFRISVHAKSLGEIGGGLLYSKGRKTMWSFLCLLQWQNGLAWTQTVFLWGA